MTFSDERLTGRWQLKSFALEFNMPTECESKTPRKSSLSGADAIQEEDVQRVFCGEHIAFCERRVGRRRPVYAQERFPTHIRDDETIPGEPEFERDRDGMKAELRRLGTELEDDAQLFAGALRRTENDE